MLGVGDADLRRDILSGLPGLCRDVPAYGAYGTIRRWGDLPTITKRDILESPQAFVSRSAAATEPLWAKATSGTTGRPITLFADTVTHVYRVYLSVLQVLMRARLQRLFDAPVLWLHLTDSPSATARLLLFPDDYAGAMFKVSVVSQPSVPDLASLLARVRPAVLATRPEILRMLLRGSFAASLHRAGWSPDLVVLSGSASSAAERRGFAEQLQCPVVNAYASSEFGLIASECPHGHMHVDPGAAVAEAVTVGDQQTLVLSSVANRAMPLLRYITGDAGMARHARWPCGESGTAVVGLEGRLVPLFETRAGNPYSPTALNDLLMALPVDDFCARQTRPGSIEILIDLPGAPLLGVERAVEAYVRARVPDEVDVVVHRHVFGTTKRHRYVVVQDQPS